MRFFKGFTDTFIAFRDGKLAGVDMEKAFFVFHCHEQHLFPEGDCYVPYEITWGTPNSVSLAKCALPEYGLLVEASVPKAQVLPFREFQAIIKRALAHGRAVFLKSCSLEKKMKFAYQLAIARGMRTSSDNCVWPDRKTPSGGVTTGRIPHPQSEEMREMLEDKPAELELLEEHIDGVIRALISEG